MHESSVVFPGIQNQECVFIWRLESLVPMVFDLYDTIETPIDESHMVLQTLFIDRKSTTSWMFPLCRSGHRVLLDVPLVVPVIIQEIDS